MDTCILEMDACILEMDVCILEMDACILEILNRTGFKPSPIEYLYTSPIPHKDTEPYIFRTTIFSTTFSLISSLFLLYKMAVSLGIFLFPK